MSHKVFHPFVVLILALSLSFVPASTAFATRAQQAASNLIVNGDFESGNTGFSSGYPFGPINLFEGVYGVLTDPFSVHPAAASFGDHTSGLGLMMAINGVGSPGIVVWSQSVPVTANTDYEFSAWIASWHPTSPAQLQFLINGSSIGTFTASSTTGAWLKFAAIWNSGASTSATIEIINLNIEPFGNDFALDDLTLRSLACDTPTDTPTNTPTNTPTATPASDLGQLKVCQVAATGVAIGQIFTIKVGNINYNVPAGYCVLAGQFPLNTQVTVQETIPASHYVSRIEVRPDSRTISNDSSIGIVVVKIGSGVTEVIFTNKIVGMPTPTPTPTLASTSTPRPTRTPTSTPSCAPNCTPTPTPIPTGRMQICKEADGAGVSGNFTFRFNTNSRSIPVGACTLIISVNAGTLTITEDAQAGYVVSDVYTIPAGRLISEDLNSRSVTVTIVQGYAASQTIVVFVNRAVTSQVITDVVSTVPRTAVRLSENPLDAFMQILRNGVRGWLAPAHATVYTQ